MRILQILPKMDQGGVEKGVLDFASHFKERMVVISGGGRLVSPLQKEGVVHYTLPVYKKSPLSILLIPKVRAIIKKENIDIVHARSRVPAWISFFATRGLNAQFITTAHGAYAPHFFSRVMSWGKFVICPSKTIVRHMIDCFDMSEEKVRIVSRWVDLDKFIFRSPKQKHLSHTIVSVGRITPSKGFEYLIEAFRKVVRTNPYLSLHIVGEAEKSKLKYLNYLKSLIHRYALSYNVKFLGYRNDIARLLDDAAILVLPSIAEEAFGRVVIEAFAKGVPVIATKVGALEEIVEDRKDGLLVFPRNSDALAGALIEVLHNPSLAASIAYCAREKVEKLYSFSHCTAQTEKVYQETKTLTRILVLKFSSLGDTILSIPSLKALKETFPQSKLVLLTLKKYAVLFYDCPYVDKIIGVDQDYKTIKNIFTISKHLVREGFDYIVDLQNNRASHLISFLSFPRKSFGYSRKFGFLLTSKLKVPKVTVSPLDSQEKILRLLGVTIKEKRLTFWDVKESSCDHLGLAGSFPLIGIGISASVKWKSKNWPLAHIKKFIEMTGKEFPECTVVLIGDKMSVPLSTHLESSLKSKNHNLCGKTTLRDLVYLLRNLKVFVTPDTAPLHLAQALGVQTLALFGPTNPDRHTVEDKNLHVFCKKLPCSFCYNPRCDTRACMEKITPQEVFMKVKTILKSG